MDADGTQYGFPSSPERRPRTHLPGPERGGHAGGVNVRTGPETAAISRGGSTAVVTGFQEQRGREGGAAGLLFLEVGAGGVQVTS